MKRLPWNESEVIFGTNEMHPHTGHGLSVRMSTCGTCVEMIIRLKAVHDLQVSTTSGIVRKWFQPVRWMGQDYYADTKTGTLYRREDGASNSPFLRIVGS